MSTKTPYFSKAPLVAREFIGMPSPYSLILRGSINYSENKGSIRKGTGHRPAPASESRVEIKMKQSTSALRRRRLTWITPCKRSAARGKRYTLPTNSVGVELLRSSCSGGRPHPELRFACTGLSMYKSYGLTERISTLGSYY